MKYTAIRMPVRLIILAALLGLAVVVAALGTSCGGGGALPVEAVSGSISLPDVGALDRDEPKEVSYTSEPDHPAEPADFFDKSANAEIDGEYVLLESEPGGFSYAIYQFGSFFLNDLALGVTVDADHDGLQGSGDFEYYIGMANFYNDAWAYGPRQRDTGEVRSDLTSPVKCASPLQKGYIVILVHDGAAIRIKDVTAHYLLTGRELDHLRSELPIADIPGVKVEISMVAVDENDYYVYGFNGSGVLSCPDPNVDILGHPELSEGEGEGYAIFHQPGTYELFVDDLDPLLDGSLGEIEIRETPLPVYEIEISKEDYRDLRRYPYGDEYKPGTFTIDGVVYPDIETRFRGGDARDHPKKSWKVRLQDENRYYDDEWGYERSVFNLNSQYTDPTLLREKLSYDLMQDMGVLASRARFAHLRVNGAFYGVVIDVENPRKKWLKAMGVEDDGVLYTANNNRFQTLDSPADYDGPFTKQTREEEPFDDLHEFISYVNDLEPEEVYEGLKPVLTVSRFTNFMVANTLISQQRHLRHNYLLYYDDVERMEWIIIPWDHDFTWGRSDHGIEGKFHNMSLIYDAPIDWGNWDIYDDGNNLYTVFLEDPTYMQEYKDAIAEALDLYFVESTLQARITEYAELIHEDMLVDIRKFGTNEEYDGYLQDLRDYIGGRRAYLLNQVSP